MYLRWCIVALFLLGCSEPEGPQREDRQGVVERLNERIEESRENP